MDKQQELANFYDFLQDAEYSFKFIIADNQFKLTQKQKHEIIERFISTLKEKIENLTNTHTPVKL